MPKYSPDPIQSRDPQDWITYLQSELDRISQALQDAQERIFTELHIEPARPRDGLTVFADGSDWNPGGGRGVYTYYGGNWNKLG